MPAHALKPRQGTMAGNTSTGVLKLFALIFMFADHAGKMIYPAVPELRMLGRIAFPLYCWCMVVGFHYTRSVPKYLFRLLMVGLVSQPLYMVALNHSWKQPNIFLTLLLGLLALWGMRERKLLSQFIAPVLALCAAQLLGCDYGWRGVMLIILLYAAQGSKGGIAAVMVAFCLFWGSNSIGVNSVCGVSLLPLAQSAVGAVFTPWMKLQALAILALPFMLIPIPGNLRVPRWAGYALYPAHLVALIIWEVTVGIAPHTEQLVNAWNQLVAVF